MNNFTKRCLTALVLIPIALTAIWQGGAVYTIFLVILGCASLYEWGHLLFAKALKKDASPFSVFAWAAFGLIYIPCACFSLFTIRSVDGGIKLTLFLFIAVWATDIFAYLVGRKLGGPKLAPQISPSKTWSGLIGGVISAAIAGYFIAIYAALPVPLFFSCGAMIIAVLAQSGDLLESALKRFCNVKDSGRLLPGHGGVLDRIDGLLSAAIGLACFCASAPLIHSV